MATCLAGCSDADSGGSGEGSPGPGSGSDRGEDGDNLGTVAGEWGDDGSCIVLHDGQGRISTGFAIEGTTQGAARLSRDAALIAVPMVGASLHIDDRQGNLVDILSPANGVRADNFDWLPQNEIVYASGQSLFTTARSTALVTINESSGLHPGEVSASPDDANSEQRCWGCCTRGLRWR